MPCEGKHIARSLTSFTTKLLPQIVRQVSRILMPDFLDSGFLVGGQVQLPMSPVHGLKDK